MKTETKFYQFNNGSVIEIVFCETEILAYELNGDTKQLSNQVKDFIRHLVCPLGDPALLYKRFINLINERLLKEVAWV
jgi:hypothetical protein